MCGLVVGFSANWVFATERSDEVFSSTAANGLVGVQVFVAITLLVALVFALEVCERVRVEQLARRTEVARARAELSALSAATDERRRISRETHDIVGHALNVMLLSAGGARRALRRDPAEAQHLIETVEEVGRAAFDDLDVALGLVDQSDEIPPDRGVGDLDELVDRMQRAGVEVELDVQGVPRSLPRLVDWSVYRIVQESLTNVAKHGAAAHTSVAVQYTDGEVVITVVDDGGGAKKKKGNGQGIAGMRERVEVLGGHLYAGPRGDSGFAIRAEIPTGRVVA
jgi:signal transduction histidine kinase